MSNKWQRLIWMREFLFEFFSPAEVKFMNFQSYFSFDLFLKNETKNKYLNFVVVVQSLSHAWLFATPWAEACQASLSFTISQSLLKLMSIESIMPSNHLILCRPLLLPPSIFPSIRVFSKELAFHIRWPKYWSFSFSINPSSKYSVLIFFRTN